MALANIQAYAARLEAQDAADRERFQNFLDTIAKSREENKNEYYVKSGMSGAARFLDTLNQSRPGKLKSNWAGTIDTEGTVTPSKQAGLDTAQLGYMKPSNNSMAARLLMAQAKGQKSAEDKDNKIKFDTNYRNDPLTKMYQEAYNAAQSATTLTSGNMLSLPMAQEMVKRALVISTGDKRPSDKDVAVFGNSPQILNQAQALYDKLQAGQKFTDTDKDMVLNVVKATSGRVEKALIDHNKKWIKKGSVTYDMSPDTSNKIIDAASMLDMSGSEEKSGAKEQALNLLNTLLSGD